MTDMERLQELYQERAEYADIESDCIDAKKYTVVGGWAWSFFNWIERQASKSRREVQDDIDYETGAK